jgi:hypothetical protein
VVFVSDGGFGVCINHCMSPGSHQPLHVSGRDVNKLPVFLRFVPIVLNRIYNLEQNY